MNPTTADRFFAALTTLYRRLSVQFDLAATAFMSWLLAQSPAEQTEFLAQFGMKASFVPVIIFIARSLLTATPQPKLMNDTAAKAEARAEVRSDPPQS